MRCDWRRASASGGVDDAQNDYVFERVVTFQNGDGTTSAGRIDLWLCLAEKLLLIQIYHILSAPSNYNKESQFRPFQILL